MLILLLWTSHHNPLSHWNSIYSGGAILYKTALRLRGWLSLWFNLFITRIKSCLMYLLGLRWVKHHSVSLVVISLFELILACLAFDFFSLSFFNPLKLSFVQRCDFFDKFLIAFRTDWGLWSRYQFLEVLWARITVEESLYESVVHFLGLFSLQFNLLILIHF